MKKMRRWTTTMLLVMAVLLAMFTSCVPSGGGCGSSGGGTGYRIFHPRPMDGGHPIITWGNGTGAPTLSYSGLLNHLASWGFVVVASDSTMTQSGEAMIAGVDYLIAQNDTPGSPFYGKLDAHRIGSTGHSQGGGGAINAAVDFVCDAGMARGYLTAWFMYHLHGDTRAAQAFTGGCEICTNPNWTVEKKNY